MVDPRGPNSIKAYKQSPLKHLRLLPYWVHPRQGQDEVLFGL